MLLILALQAAQQIHLEGVCLRLPLLAASLMFHELLLQLFHALAQGCHVLLAPLELLLQDLNLVNFVLSIARQRCLQ